MIRAAALGALLAASLATGQSRPSEAELFGAPEAAAVDAGTPIEAAPPERPSEAELFGGSAPAPASEKVDQPAASDQLQPAGGDDRDQSMLGGGDGAKSQFDTDEAKADPLRIGGMLYLRSTISLNERLPGNTSCCAQVATAFPSLMDGYFDARPSDRVRGFMLARMRYNGALNPNQGSTIPIQVLQNGQPVALPGTQTTVANPSVVLDQLWLRFDIAHTAFLTVGKQHMKLGASRFWNPTDYLSPSFRDPLAVFDIRLGVNMVKLHIPWEAQGWNFYGFGLFDNNGPAFTLDRIGGGARAEAVFGSTEVGADAVFVKGLRPRFGFDASSALGPFDVYAEVALRRGADFTRYKLNDTFDESRPLEGVTLERLSGAVVQASGGARVEVNYTENNTVTFGAEYFYNPVGVDDAKLYPFLLLSNQFQPFYAAQHYAAFYAIAFGLPGGLNNVGLTLSNLGNLTDMSFVSRLDCFFPVHAYLNVELYGAVNYGNKGGVFRFGLDLPFSESQIGNTTIIVGPGRLPAPVFELGAGLRVNL
jgi:hypothetical protein